jgi:hypothetical protein
VSNRNLGDEHLDLVFGTAAEGDGVAREIVAGRFFAGKTDNEGEGVF